MAKKKKKNEYWSKTTLLSRGWSEKAIRELLPSPIFRPNPYYKNAHYMKVWYEDEVEKAEKSKKFKEYANKKKKRQESANKAIATRKKQTEEIAKNFSLDVKKIDYKTVKDMSKLHQLYIGRCEETSVYKETEFILMYLTNFQREIIKLKGCVGKDTVILEYDICLREKILEVYPEILISNTGKY